MKPLSPDAAFSRQAGTPPHGKRTARASTYVSPLTKERAQEIAERCNCDPAVVYHAILVHAIHEDEEHAITVTKVYLGRKK